MYADTISAAMKQAMSECERRRTIQLAYNVKHGITATTIQKAIATQIARLALAGHAVHKGQHGDFIVCKYGMTRYCKDFAELQNFAVKLGVNK